MNKEQKILLETLELLVKKSNESKGEAHVAYSSATIIVLQSCLKAGISKNEIYNIL